MTSNCLNKLTVIIPVYNERRTIARVLDRVLAVNLPCEREILVVDDGSTDGSRDILRQYARQDPRIHLLVHRRNRGKGHALRTAIREATGDWILIQDADLEYDPADWAALLLPAREGIADAVYGSRFLTGRYRRAMYFWHTIANTIVTTLSNVLNDLNLTDVMTCYKLVRTDILKTIKIRSSGFSIEPELTAKLARWGARIYEVPISYQGRSYAEGKKIRSADAVRAIAAMIYYRFFDISYTSHEGFMILQAVRRARRFNRWLFSQFDRHIGDDVLEAGSGIGNLTELLLDRRRLVCLDDEDFYVRRLEQSYGHLANFSVARADLRDLDSLRANAAKQPLDTIICINVLEHIDDDEKVLANFREILCPGGRAIILVPHDPRLYTGVDEALGHFRRYTREELSNKLRRAGFRVLETRGFNRVGGLGWWISGKILGHRTLSPNQMSVFELLLPLVRLVEPIPFHPHNSVIAVGQRPQQRELPPS